MCLSAISKGFDAICFNEHVDMNPLDTGFGFFDYEKYSDAVKAAQDTHSGRLKILKGIEFSAPHLYADELERLNGLDFDFILGSVHWVDDRWIGDKKYTASLPIPEIYRRHYRETVKACRTGLFDSLAHVDFPVRYLPEAYEDESLLGEILDAIIENGISLEINTSPIRKGKASENPSPRIQEMYRERGGKYFTIGSDAHRTEDIGSSFQEVLDRSSPNLCYYEKRKRVMVSGARR